MSDLRTAVIGYGMAGATIHAPAIAVTDGLELTAVVTANPARAAAASATHPGVRVVPAAENLWSDAAGLDLIVIATPNRLHVPLALAAIEHGLAVVIDKPVAATAEEVRRIEHAAAAAGVTASAFHNRRWDGSSKTVRALVASGVLGTVHRFEARFDRWRPEVAAGAWREGADPADAGGLLYDLGSHLVDQAISLFGPVDTVYAEVRAIRPGAAADDEVFLALTHISGTVSHLWASSVAADLGPWLRVLGSTASYTKVLPDTVEPALRAGGRPGDAGFGMEPPSAWGRLGTPGETVPVETARGGYEGFYADLVTSLRTGGAPPVPLAEAVAVAAVLDAARASARTGEIVRM